VSLQPASFHSRQLPDSSRCIAGPTGAAACMSPALNTKRDKKRLAVQTTFTELRVSTSAT